jgi:hypothetical protein
MPANMPAAMPKTNPAPAISKERAPWSGVLGKDTAAV